MTHNTAKAQLWASRLDHFLRSDLSISQFGRNERVNPQVFSYWRKKHEASLSSSASIGSDLAAEADIDFFDITNYATFYGVFVDARCDNFESKFTNLVTWHWPIGRAFSKSLV